jgi:hypothetical protein
MWTTSHLSWKERKMEPRTIASSLLATTILLVSWLPTGAQEPNTERIEKSPRPNFRSDFGWEWMMSPQELRIGHTFGQASEDSIVSGYSVVDARSGALQLSLVQAGRGVIDMFSYRPVLFDAAGERYLPSWSDPKSFKSYETELYHAIYILKPNVLEPGKAAYIAVERRTLLGGLPTPPGMSGWRYPTAEYSSGGSGGGRSGIESHAAYNYTASTRDDYATVVKYFQQLAGTTLENGSTDEIAVIEDSRDRPVALKIISRRWQGLDASVTTVVSRAEGEERTHIDLQYYAGPRRSSLPKPFDLRDWTYPTAKLGAGGGIGSRMTTRDDYAAVVKYYQDKAGAIRVDGSPLENGSISSREIEVAVNDDSQRRPVALKAITRWWREGSVTAVVSRARGEDETHIDLIYRASVHP